MHAAMGAFASAPAWALFALGGLSAGGSSSMAAHFATVEDLVAAIAGVLGRDTTLLIKGSRFMRMERVVEALGAVNGEQTAKGGA
jgi:UDP-N-acetylmuramoyl-tripeptide--D-alanyl-D-alanine ligase